MLGTYLTKSASFLETLDSFLKMGKLGISKINPAFRIVLRIISQDLEVWAGITATQAV